MSTISNKNTNIGLIIKLIVTFFLMRVELCKSMGKSVKMKLQVTKLESMARCCWRHQLSRHLQNVRQVHYHGVLALGLGLARQESAVSLDQLCQACIFFVALQHGLNGLEDFGAGRAGSGTTNLHGRFVLVAQLQTCKQEEELAICPMKNSGDLEFELEPSEPPTTPQPTTHQTT